jgi:uncharacterized protein YecE (DUF72 family)
MKLHVGTSGFSYDAWYGTFYPEDLAKREMLSYYSKHFDTCEIHNTFYRMPTPKLVEGWAKQVPETFSFALKASMRISHLKRLKGTGPAIKLFLKAHAALGQRTGPVLVALHPTTKKDVPLLEDFFERIPANVKLAMELSHPTWHSDDVYDVMKKRGAALVTVDDEEKAVGFERTAPFGYVRLRRVVYKRAELEAWAKKIADAGFTESAYVFFKHEDEATGPRLAERFLSVADVERE